MPLVKVEIIKGKTKIYKKGLLDGIHKALVKAFCIPDSDRIQRIYEIDKNNFEYSSNKTENITLIEITIFEGRSKEAKERLYKEIVFNLKTNCNIESADIIIVLNEPAMHNWGLGGVSGEKYKFNFELKIN